MKTPRKHRLKTLFLAVGEMTVTWAYLEAVLDQCIDAICEIWGGKELGIEIPRTSLSRKLEFMREWHKRYPKASSLFPDLPARLNTVGEGSDFRHALIHGIVFDMTAYEVTGTARILRTERDRKRGYKRSMSAAITVKKIRTFRNQVLHFAVFFGALAEILRGDDPEGGEKPQQSLRELLSKLA